MSGLIYSFVVHFFIGKNLSVCTFGYIKKDLDMQNTKNDLHRMCFAANFSEHNVVN